MADATKALEKAFRSLQQYLRSVLDSGSVSQQQTTEAPVKTPEEDKKQLEENESVPEGAHGLALIAHASRLKRWIFVDYHGLKNKGAHIIAPYSFRSGTASTRMSALEEKRRDPSKSFGGASYLYAYYKQHQRVHSFRLDRIVEVVWLNMELAAAHGVKNLSCAGVADPPDGKYTCFDQKEYWST